MLRLAALQPLPPPSLPVHPQPWWQHAVCSDVVRCLHGCTLVVVRSTHTDLEQGFHAGKRTQEGNVHIALCISSDFFLQEAVSGKVAVAEIKLHLWYSRHTC